MNEENEHKEDEEANKEEYEFTALGCELKCREEIDELKKGLEDAIEQSKKLGADIDESTLIFHSSQILGDGVCESIFNKGVPLKGILSRQYHIILLLISDIMKAGNK